MQVIVAASKEQQAELGPVIQESIRVEWIDEATGFNRFSSADAYIDLLYQPSENRGELLKSLSPAIVVIGSVLHPLKDLPGEFIRINHWPGFLSRPLLEASCSNEAIKEKAENLFAAFNRQISWVPDITGFISSRVISMIINEAYFTWEEKVSSREDIDTAMKLGTNYPYGPFEWARKIGPQQVAGLLELLSVDQPRYTPAASLKNEAN